MGVGYTWTPNNLLFGGSLLWFPYISPSNCRLFGVNVGLRVQGFGSLGVWGGGFRKPEDPPKGVWLCKQECIEHVWLNLCVRLVFDRKDSTLKVGYLWGFGDYKGAVWF